MDPRFSILTFPQRYDGVNLHVRLLIVPRMTALWNGNPLLPLIENVPNPGDTTPAFADADVRFEARILRGFDRFPVNAPVDATVGLPQASGVAPGAHAIFEELATRFQIESGPPSRVAEAPAMNLSIQKYLPQSYRSSFLFTGPRTRFAVTDDSYECAFRDDTPDPTFVATPDSVSWGQVYAYCLRHPVLAQRIGLIRRASFAVDPGLFADGGFLYIDFAGDGAYAAQAADFTFIKRYAARIPSLEDGEPRQVFAAVQLPVLFDDGSVPGGPTAPGNYDDVFIEAAEYDDGFAKIVHASQPVSQNLLAEEADHFPPTMDIGIRLGWDDEQILIWQNRQMIDVPDDPKLGAGKRLDAPMGVFGYRIDVREHDQPETPWHSLERVRSKAPLTLGGIPLADPPDQLTELELAVEVHPQKLGPQFWLPAYLAQWNGKSLVLPDEEAADLFKTTDPGGPNVTLGRLYDAVGIDAVPLRYGANYDFRVRLMDPTGGGPEEADRRVHDSLAPEATRRFLRHVVPEPVSIDEIKALDAEVDEGKLYEPFAGNALTIQRPLLGYPSVVFTGKYPDPIPLLQAASDAAVGKGSFGIPDPDVTQVQIEVEVRALSMDNLQSISRREPWAFVYRTTRAFPADFALPRVVPLQFQDAAVLNFDDTDDFGDLGTQADIDAMDAILLPTAREVRLTIRALANEDANYFAGQGHIGKPVQVLLRRESADETGLFANLSNVMELRGIYLQPDPLPVQDGTMQSLFFSSTTLEDPAIIQRLAGKLEVEQKGMTLVGKPGERVVFGCSRHIRHTLAPDNSSLTFAAKEDLVNHWIVALTMKVERDWTWDGLDRVSFEIFRDKSFHASGVIDNNNGQPVGDWEVVPAASLLSLRDPKRDHTTLIFLDAVEPKRPEAEGFPDLIDLKYRIETRFKAPPAASDPLKEMALQLPVTTPPTQMPRIASAGIALSPYVRDLDGYSRSDARQRYLWLEFEEPIKDPNDTYFVRLLGYAADPLLSDERGETFIPPEEPPLPIDSELVRVIPPGHTDDNAGLSAMVPLTQATGSQVHYLMPLPPGLHVDSAELFGFFTYELRVGHINICSTAQGRFGRPLRTTGVQHPAPTLFCTCYREEDGALTVEAPYAESVLHGKNVRANPPRTAIWALLYAQVKQADGKDWRNILLDDRQLYLLPRIGGFQPFYGAFTLPTGFQNKDAPASGAVTWQQDHIEAMLDQLGLPVDSPLSVLCVEVMPTLEALRNGSDYHREVLTHDYDDPGDLARAIRRDVGLGKGPGAVQTSQVRPLSDALGYYRILRTSPLTPAPAVC